MLDLRPAAEILLPRFLRWAEEQAAAKKATAQAGEGKGVKQSG